MNICRRMRLESGKSRTQFCSEREPSQHRTHRRQTRLKSLETHSSRWFGKEMSMKIYFACSTGLAVISGTMCYMTLKNHILWSQTYLQLDLTRFDYSRTLTLMGHGARGRSRRQSGFPNGGFEQILCAYLNQIIICEVINYTNGLVFPIGQKPTCRTDTALQDRNRFFQNVQT